MFSPELAKGNIKPLIPFLVESTHRCCEAVDAILDGSRA